MEDQTEKIEYSPEVAIEIIQNLIDSYVRLFSHTIRIRHELTVLFYAIDRYIQGKENSYDIQVLKIILDMMRYSPHFGSRSNLVVLRKAFEKYLSDGYQTLEEVAKVSTSFKDDGLNIAPECVLSST